MGRAPCCEKMGLKRGPWTQDEDQILINYIRLYGHSNWRALPKQAGLLRCGKSCRLRWINYLRPDIKRGNFTIEEEETIIKLHQTLGNRWSAIAAKLPGRTDNEIKNVWHTHLKKRLNPKDKSNKQQVQINNQEALKKEEEESAQDIVSSPQQSSGSVETSVIITTKTENNNNDDSDQNDSNNMVEDFRLSDDSTLTDESFWMEVLSDDQFCGPTLMFPLGMYTNNRAESSLDVYDHDMQFWHEIFTGTGELLGMPEM